MQVLFLCVLESIIGRDQIVFNGITTGNRSWLRASHAGRLTSGGRGEAQHHRRAECQVTQNWLNPVEPALGP